LSLKITFAANSQKRNLCPFKYEIFKSRPTCSINVACHFGVRPICRVGCGAGIGNASCARTAHVSPVSKPACSCCVLKGLRAIGWEHECDYSRDYGCSYEWDWERKCKWVWVIDWCCFYYFVRNSFVALLEALCVRKETSFVLLCLRRGTNTVDVSLIEVYV